jgi:hypothetical protein
LGFCTNWEMTVGHPNFYHVFGSPQEQKNRRHEVNITSWNRAMACQSPKSDLTVSAITLDWIDRSGRDLYQDVRLAILYRLDPLGMTFGQKMSAISHFSQNDPFF